MMQGIDRVRLTVRQIASRREAAFATMHCIEGDSYQLPDALTRL